MKNLKKKLKHLFPKLASAYKEIRIKIKDKPNDIVFENIYKNNSWKSRESISGFGSELKNTVNFHRAFIELLEEFKVKILLDAPCGDFNWMKELNLPVEKYIGVDIVGKIINNNKISFGSDSKIFLKMDIAEDKLPFSDLIFCRDCLVHLSNDKIIKVLENFKNSKSKYLLTTYFKNVEKNVNIKTGNWRKLNYNLEPFNFPEPVKIIFENCPEDDENGKLSRDKYLGLWELNKLKI